MGNDGDYYDDDYLYYYITGNEKSMGGNSFENYQVTTTDPGVNLLIFTGASCLLCFLLGFLTIPGKILHPLSKRLKERVAWFRDFFHHEKRVVQDDEGTRSGEGSDGGGDEAGLSSKPSKALTGKAKAKQEKMDKRVKEASLWREVFDEKTGKYYYYHIVTKKTTWRKPLVLYKSKLKGHAKQVWENQRKKKEKKKNKETKKGELTGERVEMLLRMNEQTMGSSTRTMDARRHSETINPHFEQEDWTKLGKGLTRKRNSVNTKANGSGRLGSVKEFLGTIKRSNSDPKSRSRRNILSKGGQAKDDEFISNPRHVESSIHYVPMGDVEDVESDSDSDSDDDTVESITAPADSPRRIRKETRKIWGLGIPWIFQSIISDGSSIIQIMMISHYMGLDDMLVYSNVWFIIYLAFVLNDAWYHALYKHVNVSAALETDDGYTAAGKYLKIGMVGNFFLCLPLSVSAVVFMPNILLWFGYDDDIAEISRFYSIIALLNNIFDSTTEILDCVLDIDGHAKWCAAFHFWDSLIGTGASLAFVIYTGPSLFYLGLFHLAYDLIGSIVYFVIVHKWYGWYDNYLNGLSTPLTHLHGLQVFKVAKMTVPMLFDCIVANVEDTVFTIFAVYMGTAEAATWILLSYVWSAVGIIPECFSAAASTRVARLIGKGEIEVAKRLSQRSLYLSTFLATVCSILMYIFRAPFVWCFSLDDTLEQMLLEIIPYIVICYPFVTVGGTAMELNDALHLFKRAMVSMAIVTIMIMIPIGYVLTYIFNYNIEGLACAQCIGYTAVGVINIVFFVNASWENAVTKAHNIAEAGMMDSNSGDGNNIGAAYEDYDWDDLPDDVKLAAMDLGFDKQKWDNGEPTEYDDWDKFTERQLASASRLGYTRELWNEKD